MAEETQETDQEQPTTIELVLVEDDTDTRGEAQRSEPDYLERVAKQLTEEPRPSEAARADAGVDDGGTPPPKILSTLHALADLARIAETSPHIAPPVDAVVGNITCGHSLDYAFDLPEDQGIPAEALAEKREIETWFKTLAGKHTWAQVLKRAIKDRENAGDGFIEIIPGRDPSARAVAQVEHVRSTTIDVTEVGPRIMVSEVIANPENPKNLTPVQTVQRFRLFRQTSSNGQDHWFKESGDPRVIDSRNGRAYDPNSDKANTLVETGRAATPLLPLGIYSSTSQRSLPRWYAAIIPELMARLAGNVNYNRMEQNQIPPYLIAVVGAHFSQPTKDGILRRLKKTKGQGYSGDPVFVELEQADGGERRGNPHTTTPSLTIKPLTDQQPTSEIYKDAAMKAANEIGAQYRLGPILRGYSEEVRMAVAQAALRIAESQVFGPMREELDDILTKHLLRANGWHYWNYVTSPARIVDPDGLATQIQRVTPSGAVTPQEAKDLMRNAWGVDAVKVEEPYASTPVPVYQVDGGPAVSPEEEEGARAVIKRAIADTLQEIEAMRAKDEDAVWEGGL